MDFSFPKSKHLCRKMVIDRLFASGDKLLVYPLRVVYSVSAADYSDADDAVLEPVRVLFVVPKRYYKHAVDRNRYKRLLRESYRLQQNALIDELKKNNLRIDMAVSVINNDFNLSYANIYPKMTKVINKIIEKVSTSAL